jgi:glycerate kinase
MEQGILTVFSDATVKKMPIADGGEGTVEALVTATGGRIIRENVTGPSGQTLEAFWGILGDGETAVIEMAAASGLTLIADSKRDPRFTTSYGTGQLIKAALDHGLCKLIIGIGGSATNDGGAGMAQALGVRFHDKSGEELPIGGLALSDLAAIDLTGLDSRLDACRIFVACDVDNPLCGQRGASAVFGPQKGATPETVAALDAALSHYALIAMAATGKNIADYPGAGAAGGLGAGLLFFTNARLKPGIEIVLDAIGFESAVKQAHLVITGEGCTDFQTAYGKAPVGVAKIAAQYHVPTVCLSGGLGPDYNTVLSHGVRALMSIPPGPMTLEDCLANAPVLIREATARLCQMIAVGCELGHGTNK